MVGATRQTLVKPGEANSQAATKVNLYVASSYRPPHWRGNESAEPFSPRRRLIHSPDITMRHQEVKGLWFSGVTGVACEESLDGVTREVHRYPIRRVSATIRPSRNVTQSIYGSRRGEKYCLRSETT